MTGAGSAVPESSAPEAELSSQAPAANTPPASVGPSKVAADPSSVRGPSSPVPPSSDPRVADALSRLEEADRLPLPEQVAVYTDIHRRLAGVLADPDSQA